MPNKNYISGRNFEYRVKKHLESKGYFVLRSAGSKSPIDLIAISWNRVYLIQCKHNSSKRPNDKEIKKVMDKLAFPFILAYNENKEMVFDRYRIWNGKMFIHEMEL